VEKPRFARLQKPHFGQLQLFTPPVVIV